MTEQQSHFDHSTLQWVKRELDDTLHQSADALQQFSEDANDRTQLQFCVTHLHQVQGILQMLELHGAVMLTEEMEGVGKALLDDDVGNHEQACEALMRGILRLRDYLERVGAGEQDSALLILPLINDLRATRGQPIIAASALFSPDLDAVPEPPRQERDGNDTVATTAARNRADYLRGLLGVLKGISEQRSAERMVAALDALDAASPDEATGNVWWIAAGLVEALREGQLDEYSPTVRYLLGQVERRMKAVIDQGRPSGLSGELPRGMLYYIARTEATTERLKALHQTFGLADLLAEERRLEEAREGFFGPGMEAFSGVADAIREDLATVKDTLDLYMRGNEESAQSLPEAAESMRRIADTLGVLGLADSRRIVSEQADIIGELGPDSARSTVAIEKAAEALLYVESTLADLVDRGRVDEGDTEGREAGDALFDREYREVLGSTVSHAITEVGRIKEGLVQFLENGDTAHLDGLASSFEGVRGALSVIELTRAAELILGAERYVNDVLRPGQAPPTQALDDLADAVTSIEYYLEAIRDGRSGTEQILDVAAESLDRLGYGSEGQSDSGGPAGSDEPSDQDVVELEVDAASDTVSPAEEPAHASPPPAEAESAEPAAAPPVATDDQGVDLSKKRGRVNLDVPVCSDEFDEEILDIFVDEAEEVLETINECFPRWRDNPEDRESLVTTRRMFHTLKGSGRMAGGLLLGELAWAIENLLNRVLDKTLNADPAIPAMVEESIGYVRPLVEQLRGGTAPEAEVRELMRRAAVWSDPSQAEAASSPSEPGGAHGQAASQSSDDDGHDPVVDHEPGDTGHVGNDGAAEEDSESGKATGPEPEQALDHTTQGGLASAPGVQEDELDDTVAPGEGDTTGQSDPGITRVDESPADNELSAEIPASDGGSSSAQLDDQGSEAGPAMDATLYEIFSKETLDHLAIVEDFLAGCDEGACEPNSDLLRSLHTLTGSARMAQVDSISRLGRALEELARARQNNHALLDADDQGCLQRGAVAIRELVNALGDQGRAQPDVEALIVEAESRRATEPGPTLEAMSAAPETSGTGSVFERPAAMHEPLAPAAFTPPPAASEVAPETAMEEAAASEVSDEEPAGSGPSPGPASFEAESSVFDRPAALGEPLPAAIWTAAPADPPTPSVASTAAESDAQDDAASQSPSPSQGFVDAAFSGGESLTPFDPRPAPYAVAMADAASSAVPQPDAVVDSLPDDQAETATPPDAEMPSGPDVAVSGAEEEFTDDGDLTGIFLEEAQDILDSFDDLIARWEVSTDPDVEVAELQRSLHTLKGGARLAALEAVGDFCHALETLAADISTHKLSADDAVFDLLRDCIDELVRVVDVARNGDSPEPSGALVQRIEQLRGGDTASSEAAAADEAPPDQELLEVFLEEASDILDQSENLLQSWRQSPTSTETITELERALHTLKGGARMAGLQSVADLSHSLETLLKEVRGGELSATEVTFDLLDNANDRLVQLRDAAQAGQRLTYPRDLLNAVQALQRGETPEGMGRGTQQSSTSASEAAAAPAAQESTEAAKETAQSGGESSRAQSDTVRVRADLLDNLVNYAGEVSIYRARLEQQTGAINFNLDEFEQTVQRLREQLRSLEIETESQMHSRSGNKAVAAGGDAEGGGEGDDESFDPLEMDRFSRVQELSRALSESVNDLSSIEQTINNLNRESETLLLQQSRVNTDLQDGLMRTRMVPFANLVPRLRRIVRQASQDMGKRAGLQVLGAEGEMDRTVLERVVPPLEHMLRNSVAHGIEDASTRAQRGKPEDGSISVSLDREGADVVIRVIDDGGGMDLEAIRRKAISQGFMREDTELTDREVMQFVLESGFSTATQVSQVAGRGVGMDVVNAEIKQLGGNLEIDSVRGEGTRLTIRLPFTLALNQAILCKTGDETYAIPLSSIEGVTRLDHPTLRDYLARPGEPVFEYAGAYYEVRSLAAILGGDDPELPQDDRQTPLILVQAGEHRIALQVDSLLGSRDIVVKSVGSQISTVQGIFGATILADGRVVLILDVSAMVRLGLGAREKRVESLEGAATIDAEPQTSAAAGPQTVMVVDDSITMRKVASRLLERNNLEVLTAKDGVDAVSQLQETVPDAMLLDIEMPRMDGYELATHMRNDDRLRGVPIVMITSRTGEKHRERAMDIGVDRYLGKPYQESDLLGTLNELLEGGRDVN
jgi:chemosensory pili system protein ChpA (sensor histidine kinase/response regulator)